MLIRLQPHVRSDAWETPEEAAGAVLFSALRYPTYVTGEMLICSGGFHF
jgi:hypothetical protein